ncbi:MAG TPA: DUF3108 domain-containing protein [Candidatus Binatia bacterium]|nr:DUF3108 domain-containing protein [Candidatus Binatia bacterium]
MFTPKLNWLAFFIVFGLLAGAVSQAGEATVKPENLPVYTPKFYPFDRGEKGVYRATWNGLFSVATAEVTTTSSLVDGKRVYQVRVDAKTAKALDLIWKMRDTIRSTFDAKSLSPSHFLFNQRENSRIIDTEAKLDLAAKRWAVTRQQVGKRTKIYHFDSQNTFDPVTAVYLARSVDFKVGDKLYFKVFGGRYHYLLELFVEKKEPVALPSGKTVEAYKIVPQVQNLKKSGYASRLREAAIWISADERRLPVKLSSKILFGSVQLDLVEDKHGVQSTAANSEQPAS